jgi:hypothetical protein
MSIRSRALAAIAAVALAAAAGAAQAQSLAGSWVGTAMGVGFQLTVQPNGAYIETERKGALMTQQTGVIRQTGAGVISFVVENWSPKTMPVYHATGTVGGYYTQQPTSKPPGGTYRIVWRGPTSFTLTDTTYGGSITFQRAG